MAEALRIGIAKTLVLYYGSAVGVFDTLLQHRGSS